MVCRQVYNRLRKRIASRRVDHFVRLDTFLGLDSSKTTPGRDLHYRVRNEVVASDQLCRRGCTLRVNSCKHRAAIGIGKGEG